MRRVVLIIYLCLCVFASDSQTQNRNDVDFNWDAKMKGMGLLDVCFWDPSIQCYLVYATYDNFLNKPLYNSKLTRAWLHPRAAKMLIHAQEYLLHGQRAFFHFVRGHDLHAVARYDLKAVFCRWRFAIDRNAV